MYEGKDIGLIFIEGQGNEEESLYMVTTDLALYKDEIEQLIYKGVCQYSDVKDNSLASDRFRTVANRTEGIRFLVESQSEFCKGIRLKVWEDGEINKTLKL